MSQLLDLYGSSTASKSNRCSSSPPRPPHTPPTPACTTLPHLGVVKLHGIQLLAGGGHEVADEARRAKREAVHVLCGDAIHLHGWQRWVGGSMC